ncbi:hypothetical protein V8G54_023334 [Vigna mungo]|uniref:Uncharacterized protein n=1 Tax=Vigna mungo TaxID=3915 RepID=A0AAQ3N3F0_VIGMU
MSRASIDDSAIGPNFPRSTRLQVTHFKHSFHKGFEKLILICTEESDKLPCLWECEKCLIRVEKPSPSNQVLEILIIKHKRRKVKVPCHILINIQRTKSIKIFPIASLNGRIRPSSSRLIV